MEEDNYRVDLQMDQLVVAAQLIQMVQSNVAEDHLVDMEVGVVEEYYLHQMVRQELQDVQLQVMGEAIKILEQNKDVVVVLKMEKNIQDVIPFHLRLQKCLLNIDFDTDFLKFLYFS